MRPVESVYDKDEAEDEARQKGQDRQGEQHLLVGDAAPATDVPPSAPPADLVHLALTLLAELGACIQMIGNDLVRAHETEAAQDARDLELEVAAQRWTQRLRAMITLLEAQVGGERASMPLPVRDPHPSAHAPRVTLPAEPGYSRLVRSVPPARLTRREREVLRLAEKGYPPRTIAPRLCLSVETVYTHLRNIRRKQRQQHAQQQQ